jgi:hypothetical protein
MLFALATPLTDSATVRLPADSHALAHGKVAYLGACGRDGPYDLVPGDEGELADSPIIVDQMYIGVADPAMGDLYLNLIYFQIAGFISIGH